MVEALYISNFDIFGVKLSDNQGKNKKIQAQIRPNNLKRTKDPEFEG